METIHDLQEMVDAAYASYLEAKIQAEKAEEARKDAESEWLVAYEKLRRAQGNPLPND